MFLILKILARSSIFFAFIRDVTLTLHAKIFFIFVLFQILMSKDNADTGGQCEVLHLLHQCLLSQG